MENKKYKCSSKEHKEFEANFYCQKCNIYICNKCEKHHNILFINHNLITFYKHHNIRGILELAKNEFFIKSVGGKMKKLVRLEWKKFNEFRRRGGSDGRSAFSLPSVRSLCKNASSSTSIAPCLRQSCRSPAPLWP